MMPQKKGNKCTLFKISEENIHKQFMGCMILFLRSIIIGCVELILFELMFLCVTHGPLQDVETVFSQIKLLTA